MSPRGRAATWAGHCVRGLLADTGSLGASFKRRAGEHAPARDVFGGYRGPLISAWPVVTEVCHLVPPHVAVRLTQRVAAGGPRLVDFPDERKAGIGALIERYANHPMDRRGRHPRLPGRGVRELRRRHGERGRLLGVSNRLGQKTAQSISVAPGSARALIRDCIRHGRFDPCVLVQLSWPSRPTLRLGPQVSRDGADMDSGGLASMPLDGIHARANARAAGHLVHADVFAAIPGRRCMVDRRRFDHEGRKNVRSDRAARTAAAVPRACV